MEEVAQPLQPFGHLARGHWYKIKLDVLVSDQGTVRGVKAAIDRRPFRLASNSCHTNPAPD